MPAKFRDFGSPVNFSAASSDEPITFKIYGDVYRCKPVIQGRTLVKLMMLANSQDMAAGAAAVMDFFDFVLVEGDKQQFVDLCESEDRIVTMDTMVELMQFLVECYANTEAVEDGAAAVERPTVSSEGSSTGPEGTGLPLMVGQYVPVAVSSN